MIALMDVFKILLYSSLEMERFPFSFLVHCRFLLLVSQLLSFVFVGFFVLFSFYFLNLFTLLFWKSNLGSHV